MRKVNWEKAVHLGEEFGEVFTKMLEISGFEKTTVEQRMTLFCCLHAVYPNFASRLLKSKGKFLNTAGPLQR